MLTEVGKVMLISPLHGRGAGVTLREELVGGECWKRHPSTLAQGLGCDEELVDE